MDGDDGGAEDEFFCDGALKEECQWTGQTKEDEEGMMGLTATYVRQPVGVSSASTQ